MTKENGQTKKPTFAYTCVHGNIKHLHRYTYPRTCTRIQTRTYYEELSLPFWICWRKMFYLLRDLSIFHKPRDSVFAYRTTVGLNTESLSRGNHYMAPAASTTTDNEDLCLRSCLVRLACQKCLHVCTSVLCSSLIRRNFNNKSALVIVKQLFLSGTRESVN